MTTTPLPQWSKLPTGSNPTSRTIFWINTLDDEILRNVHNATTPRGQLNSYFSPPAPTFDAAGIEIEVDPNDAHTQHTAERYRVPVPCGTVPVRKFTAERV